MPSTASLTAELEASLAAVGQPVDDSEMLASDRIAPAPVARPRRPQPRPGRRIRNYKAMADAKLRRVAQELEYYGEAYYRSLEKGSGDPDGDLALVREIAAERGLEI